MLEKSPFSRSFLSNHGTGTVSKNDAVAVVPVRDLGEGIGADYQHTLVHTILDELACDSNNEAWESFWRRSRQRSRARRYVEVPRGVMEQSITQSMRNEPCVSVVPSATPANWLARE
jgi:hypothetical protein